MKPTKKIFFFVFFVPFFRAFRDYGCVELDAPLRTNF